MTPVFTINFRREAFARRRQTERYRMIGLVLWVTYFGALAAVLGLYGLNCQSMVRRTSQVEQLTYHLGALQQRGEVTAVPPAEVDEVEKFAANPWHWRERLVHLARALPNDARIAALSVESDNGNGSNPDQLKFVIQGRMRSTAGRDDMQGMMGVVAALQRDSVFAADYPSIKLVSTRAAEAGEPATFVIECR